MGLVVIYDASVLYPSLTRDLLIRLAVNGLVRAKWTHDILDEMFAALQRHRPDLDPQRLRRTRVLMTSAVRDWEVRGYEPIIDLLELPDPDDRHVLAAGIRAGADLIVTANAKDFPSDALSLWGIARQSPDEFIDDRARTSPEAVLASVTQMAAAMTRPAFTVSDVLSAFERQGLVRTGARLRAYLAPERPHS